MSKLYDKHLFFVSKGLNWDDMPEERKYKRVHDYVLGGTYYSICSLFVSLN